MMVDLLPACDAYDFETVAARLRDQWLLMRSVAVRVYRMPLLAVPVGGSRLGGSFAADSYEVASTVRGHLQGRPGFPHLRIRVVSAPPPEQWRVEWGEEPPKTKQGATALLEFYGYTPVLFAGRSRPDTCRVSVATNSLSAELFPPRWRRRGGRGERLVRVDEQPTLSCSPFRSCHMTTAPADSHLPVVPVDPPRRVQFNEALATAHALEEAFAAAGLGRPTMNDETLMIRLPSVTIEQALTMVTAMRASMRGHFAAADCLNAAGGRHNIHFKASVVSRRIVLADLTIYEADHLASLLGRPTPDGVDPDDLDDPKTVKSVLKRLKRALMDTAGIRVVMDSLPACFCSDCGHTAGVRFLPMSKRTAMRLGKHLSTLSSTDGQPAAEGADC